jgi:hypothetical protein
MSRTHPEVHDSQADDLSPAAATMLREEPDEDEEDEDDVEDEDGNNNEDGNDGYSE